MSYSHLRPHRPRMSHAHRAHAANSRRYRSYAAPAAVGTRVLTRTPSLRASPNNAFKISNRELCFPVIAQDSSNQYSVVAFPIQPGLSAVFPLLSNSAKTFVQYKIKYCIDFVPNVSTSEAGTIFIAHDTNCTEGPPASPSQLMSYAGAVSSNIWSQTSFPSNRKMIGKNDKKMFVRYGSLNDGQDILLYDSANVFVALSGLNNTSSPPGTVVGQLYINYVCTFYEQRLEQVIDSNIFTYYQSINDVSAPINQQAERMLPYVFGSGDIQYTGEIAWNSEIGDRTTGITLVFPSQGFYLILQNMRFTMTAATSYTTPPQALDVEPIGANAMEDTSNAGMAGYAGTGVIISDPINIPATFNASGQTLTCQCLQVVQVLSSGTYLAGSNVVVGNAWLSKSIGPDAYVSGTLVPEISEAAIFDTENASAGYTVQTLDASIEVTAVSAGVADYYFPGTFSASTSAAMYAGSRLITSHLKHAALRGLQMSRFNPPTKNRALPIASTSKEIIDLDEEPEPEVVPDLRHLSDKEYREHMERLFDLRKK